MDVIIDENAPPTDANELIMQLVECGALQKANIYGRDTIEMTRLGKLFLLILTECERREDLNNAQAA